MPKEDQAQALPRLFAHELAGPLGSAGHALELLELQGRSAFAGPERDFWLAGCEAPWGVTILPKNLQFPHLPEKTAHKLSCAIAKNPAVEALATQAEPHSLDRLLKLFDLGYSLKCARLGVENSVEIVKNLRDWQSLTSPARTQKVSLEETLRKAHAIVWARMRHLSAQWHIQKLPPLVGNPSALTQVWMNLLLNAAQINRGSCKVKISLSKTPKAAQIKIFNEGQQLPRGLQLFKPGQSARHGGSGLGLHLCRQIILAHRGKISARNSLRPQGVLFTITLPC